MPKNYSPIAAVACYCRVSTENQIENYSIDEQRERLEAFCKARGWAEPEMFVDPGYSGGTLERPALRSLLDEVKRGKFGTVVVYKLDRLSRSQKDTLYLIEDVFNRYDVSFVSVCENFDTGTPFGKAMIGILSVFAQLEKDQITERFTMGRIGRAKNGLFHGGGNAPTGYDYVDGHLIVNEFEALQVQEIFGRFLNGESVHAIQCAINEKYGTHNAHTRVYNILRNSVYIGRVKFGGVEYSGEHEPLITPEQFYEAQRLLSKNSAENAQKKPFRAGFLLSGMVYCGGCGARYHGNHGYYKCYSRAKSDKKYIVDPNCKNPNIAIAELDGFVRAEIARIAFDASKLSRGVSGEQKAVETKRAFEKRAAELTEQRNRLLDLYSASGISLDGAAERLRQLEKERERLEKQIAALHDNSSSERYDQPPTSENITEIINSLDGASGRMFVSLLIDKITVMPDGSINIQWTVDSGQWTVDSTQ